jgi:hypothetical protein
VWGEGTHKSLQILALIGLRLPGFLKVICDYYIALYIQVQQKHLVLDFEIISKVDIWPRYDSHQELAHMAIMRDQKS